MPFKVFTKKLAIELGILIHEVNRNVAQRTLPKFGNTPKNLKIDLPRRIINPERMFLGDDIWLGPGSFLNAITHYPTVSMRHPEKEDLPVQQFDPKIIIGNRVTSTANFQIAAHAKIVIEDDVLFASNINITDGFHGYEHTNQPYKYQQIFNVSPIIIKQGCWIGQNVVITPGVTIGEFSIIGANSVVTESIPARCIAVGTPAKVIKRWNDVTQKWVSITKTDEQKTSIKETVAKKFVES